MNKLIKIILLLIISGCSYNAKNDNNRHFLDSIFESNKVPKYKIDTIINQVLSEIIIEEKMHPQYAKDWNIFFLTFFDYGQYMDICIEGANPDFIKLNNIGYFTYKNRIFVFDLSNDTINLLQKTKDSTIVSKYTFSYPDGYFLIDDRAPQWVCRYQDNKISRVWR